MKALVAAFALLSFVAASTIPYAQAEPQATMGTHHKKMAKKHMKHVKKIAHHKKRPVKRMAHAA